MKELIQRYYDEFMGLPSNAPLVRNGQKNDAFEIAVLSIMYGNILGFPIDKAHVTEIAKYVIAPPDAGIDIFIEREEGDEYRFDVIQVKNEARQEKQLKQDILDMERTILDFIKNPMTVKSDSCKEVLSSSNLEKNNYKNCDYYVVHTGTQDDFSGANENEHVITLDQLEILLRNKTDNVAHEIISIDEPNNLMTYGVISDEQSPDESTQKAYVCSISGYELACLNNKYYNTEKGRNILFGQNLRESLMTKTSKRYLGMKDTIDKCPENFWYFNNGITIIAESIKATPEALPTEIIADRFSIVNGAQTTSSLGLYLKEAKRNSDSEAIESLKKVRVLTRILQVSSDEMRRDVAIFNNTQNPITSRDMVANRDEQVHLNQWLLDDKYPQIYVEIRRGSQIPSTFNKGITHRKTTNEELAQLAYASFFMQPFTAKDKKSALFNNDTTQNQFVLNEIYHNVFYYNPDDIDKCGVLFRKSKAEIDELLFSQQLYKETKKYLRDYYSTRINNEKDKKEQCTDAEEMKKIDQRIAEYSSYQDTVGICMFYFISLYYEFKAQFDSSTLKRFDYDKYYQDKKFKEDLVKSAANLFLTLTVRLLRKTAQEANKDANMNNWVRGSSCQKAFLAALSDELATNLELSDKYDEFVATYKIQ